MPKCCVCGKEAEYLRHGLWWCEDHRSCVREKPETTSKISTRVNREEKYSPGNLGLEWV